MPGVSPPTSPAAPLSRGGGRRARPVRAPSRKTYRSGGRAALTTKMAPRILETTRPPMDKEGAELVGVDTPGIYAVTYGLSSALAAAAGLILATIYMLTPMLDGILLGRAFVVAVLRGLGHITGAAMGCLVLQFH